MISLSLSFLGWLAPTSQWVNCCKPQTCIDRSIASALQSVCVRVSIDPKIGIKWRGSKRGTAASAMVKYMGWWLFCLLLHAVCLCCVACIVLQGSYNLQNTDKGRLEGRWTFWHCKQTIDRSGSRPIYNSAWTLCEFVDLRVYFLPIGVVLYTLIGLLPKSQFRKIAQPFAVPVWGKHGILVSIFRL